MHKMQCAGGPSGLSGPEIIDQRSHAIVAAPSLSVRWRLSRQADTRWALTNETKATRKREGALDVLSGGLNRLALAVESSLTRIERLFENRTAQRENGPLNEKEAAAYCRMKVETLHYYGKRLNEIPYVKVGRERLYLRDDLDQFLRAQRVGLVRKVR